jgi:hypothetical protein
MENKCLLPKIYKKNSFNQYEPGDQSMLSRLKN